MAKRAAATLRDLLKNIELVYKELDGEHARGCVLSAVQYLDEHLRLVLLKYFVDDRKCNERLLEFERPLGSFSARIDIAYACGLLRKDMYDDLHTIREIRNLFAHSWLPIDFSNTAVKDRTMNLIQIVRTKVSPATVFVPRLSDAAKKQVLIDPRKRFIFTVGFLIGEMICINAQTIPRKVSTMEIAER